MPTSLVCSIALHRIWKYRQKTGWEQKGQNSHHLPRFLECIGKRKNAATNSWKGNRSRAFKKKMGTELGLYYIIKMIASITTVLIWKWLTAINAKMDKDSRKVFLLLANCTAYGNKDSLAVLELKSIEVVFSSQHHPYSSTVGGRWYCSSQISVSSQTN